MSDRLAATGAATRRRAIHVTAMTRGANREEAAIEPAAFLAKRRVDDVGASGRSDWTRTSNRGTRDTTDSVRRSIEAVTEGLEVLRPDPHLTLSAVRAAYATPWPAATVSIDNLELAIRRGEPHAVTGRESVGRRTIHGHALRLLRSLSPTPVRPRGKKTRAATLSKAPASLTVGRHLT